MRGIRILFVAAALASTVAGCARTGGAYNTGSAQPAARAVTVSVQNDYMLAMDIYAVASGNSTRLGSVSPGMHETLVLDPALMPDGLVQLVARPAGGGRTIGTGTLNPQAGQTVDWHIDFNPENSRVTIR